MEKIRVLRHCDLVPDQIKASRMFSILEKPSHIFRAVLRLGILVCLVASIYIAIHSAFLTPTGWFALPNQLNHVQNVSDFDDAPTNMSHLLFGLAGSVNTLSDRHHYSELWWNVNTTRGFVWLEKQPGTDVKFAVPCRVSDHFNYMNSQFSVRIARIVYESFKLGLPNVRWFVMGDDDTVFFPENLVSVLAKYDHKQMYYIGGNSESVEQDDAHSYNTAFGGGGYAISYPLAAQLFRIFDGCLYRYSNYYGSDERIAACVSEVGVPLTSEKGFHQFDIKGNPYGLLVAHPLAPLVSLHHLDNVTSLFPEKNRTDSVKTLISAYHADPARTLQQSICYHRQHGWSMSISWGYAVQVYPYVLTPNVLQMPLRTFRTWSSNEGPFTFNTRVMSPDPCQQPIMFLLNRVDRVGQRGTVTTYDKAPITEADSCKEMSHYARALNNITVTARKMASQYWTEAPRRQCCELLDGGKIRGGILRIRIRKCKLQEAITS